MTVLTSNSAHETAMHCLSQTRVTRLRSRTKNYVVQTSHLSQMQNSHLSSYFRHLCDRKFDF